MQNSSSLQVISEKERMERWLDEARANFCSLDFEPPRDDALRGSIDSVPLGPLILSKVHCNAREIRHSPSRAGDDGDHFVALVMLQGELEIRQGRHASQLKAGDMVIHDCQQPYRLTFGSVPHELYGLRIPQHQIAKAVASPHDLTARAVSGARLPAQILKAALEQVHRQGEGASDPSGDLLGDVLVGTVAAGLRELAGSLEPGPRSLGAYHLARIRDHVRCHLADPELSIAGVAAAVGLSSDHVGRLFRGQPRTLAEWIWHERLEACRRDLADPRLAACSVSEIGYRWGFADAAHFSRRFRQAHGQSPRDYRLHAAGEQESCRSRSSR